MSTKMVPIYVCDLCGEESRCDFTHQCINKLIYQEDFPEGPGIGRQLRDLCEKCNSLVSEIINDAEDRIRKGFQK